ncbi:MAG: nickel pincer cofactor biosynthesis protein LarC [Deltaproteobacteria bacterium]|nr:MAG: nickel pincer cofactor biosynthesis protein LarC [Deltaproteobacteria bacterium]
MLAYFDCFCGISGDMTLAALVDLGVPVDWLTHQLCRMPLVGFDLTVKPLTRNGIQAKIVQVDIKDDRISRDYAEIQNLIQNSNLSDRVKRKSLAIFETLAEAEAAVHGCPTEKVHFHEIGGIDALVDIIGTVLCLEYLGIQAVRSSKIPLGSGFVSSRHGTIPIPAPATLEILKNIPVYGTGVDHELVTPTGAAIVATLAESFDCPPEMIIKKTGYGAGTRDLEEMPNLLRIIVATLSGKETNPIVVVETCIDDMNPEIFGFVMDRLFEDGALDVYWIPVFMKKNRPGTMVQVLCSQNRRDAIIDRLVTETTSIGIRYHDVHRRILQRDPIEIETTFGTIRVKRITYPGGNVRIVPEYEVCKKIAYENDLPIRTVYDTITQEAAVKHSKVFSKSV